MSVAEHLALRVDSIITLPAELIADCFTKIVQEAPRPASPSAQTARPSTHPAPRPGGLIAKPAPPTRPLPYVAPRPHLAEPHLVYSSGGAKPTLVQEDSAMDVAQDMGASVTASWYGSVTQGELTELLADRPILPGEIDRVLLKDCAQRIGEYKTDLQAVRKALRLAFWEKLDELI
ncbi:hypothetical protein [Arthrobacter sp. NPDC057013]|uniref:hypothetical protein n=1 Tax=Arthrobacter sp. NPDC057013 TaxID=3345999 RepID=UPI003632B037